MIEAASTSRHASQSLHATRSPKVPSPTWRSFLHNHLTDIAATDMIVVATATFRLLYVLIVLGHDRR